jgi:predicted XRE-type DNA-binding protein
VYTVRFAEQVFVLHAFQKKSKIGIATPKADIDLIRQRLKQAIEMSKSKRRSRSRPMARKNYIVGSGNVFEDLGHPRPAEALAKAELARKIAELIAKRRMTQAAAAELLSIDQPKVSALVRGRLAGFSLDRLVRFLVLLGSDVEIVVKPRSRAMGRARVLVA